MDVEETFVLISGLICEPTRARLLWNLLDGRAYTASELAIVGDISSTAASNHLAKLLDADIIKVELQGRHRYYSFAKPEVAYVVESLASLANTQPGKSIKKQIEPEGMRFCRTCYDHLAGYVAVKMADTMESKGIIQKADGAYLVTPKGWKWFTEIGIQKNNFQNSRRPLTRQCLDWTERRPHLAGQLGAVLLEEMLKRKWFKKVQFSRELIITSKGRQEMKDWLALELYR
jgi:DNA-binding transcriptional ArsR family regulator/predicted transcriptional regulator